MALNLIGGTSADTRIGKEVFVRKLVVRVSWKWTNNSRIRMILWSNKGNTFATVASPVLAGINDLITPNELERIFILKDKLYKRTDDTINFDKVWRFNIFK